MGPGGFIELKDEVCLGLQHERSKTFLVSVEHRQKSSFEQTSYALRVGSRPFISYRFAAAMSNSPRRNRRLTSLRCSFPLEVIGK